MNKTKWIIGLSIAGLIALSGTVFAINSGSVATQSSAQTPGISQTVYKPSNSKTSGNYTSPSSDNNNSMALILQVLMGTGEGTGEDTV